MMREEMASLFALNIDGVIWKQLPNPWALESKGPVWRQEETNPNWHPDASILLWTVFLVVGHGRYVVLSIKYDGSVF